MPDKIKNGFKRCGLYPFDANSPDYTKCVINSLENVQNAHKQSQKNLQNSDIKSFKKVLILLKSTLKDKSIEIQTIAKAANSLKKSLPAELGLAETSIETESDRS